MRVLAAVIAMSSPAMAWEFTPGATCILTHQTPTADIQLTYDPSQPLYTISIRREMPWPMDRFFSLRFDGAAALSISTDRHTLSQDRRTLTVTDRGFSNVLNGLQYNTSATAILGTTTEIALLDGAHDPVKAFRLCKPVAGV